MGAPDRHNKHMHSTLSKLIKHIWQLNKLSGNRGNGRPNSSNKRSKLNRRSNSIICMEDHLRLQVLEALERVRSSMICMDTCTAHLCLVLQASQVSPFPTVASSSKY